MQHVDLLFALVTDEVQVTLRFSSSIRLSCGRLSVGQGVPGLLTRLKVLDHFKHLLEEKLGLVSTLTPTRVDSRDRSLSPLR